MFPYNLSVSSLNMLFVKNEQFDPIFKRLFLNFKMINSRHWIPKDQRDQILLRLV